MGILAYRLDSRMIWLFALVSLGSWFGTETGYQTHWSYYFLGLNYPLRFVLFSVVLVSSCYILKKQKWFGFFWELTYVVGLLYLFMSLWLLSIFGNLGSIDTWWHIKQLSLFYWGVISGHSGWGFLLYGLKNKRCYRHVSLELLFFLFSSTPNTSNTFGIIPIKPCSFCHPSACFLLAHCGSESGENLEF